jgi:hypothetical protein
MKKIKISSLAIIVTTLIALFYESCINKEKINEKVPLPNEKEKQLLLGQIDT